ncbi:hypothetical protein [Phytohabitans houttuyneae]|uniref:Uncharacterized protein n=1 Tax=Phytohabitans houttuyneae TaxID=1076126 RepID=A0A6V8K2W0_9ACTN|nr:hypothetical protein [Phytohabitans houttuyneae]GFJ79473.1 hypothetical protein Phou_036530 [Phytohabitans houttuyneae]
MLDGPEGATVKLRLGGTWTDVTADAAGELVDVNRGRRNEASRVDTGSCTLSLANDTGKYSPRNPTSPYYGQLGRNTPLRVSVSGVDDRHVVLSPHRHGYLVTDDHASLDITGDIDIRVDLAPDDWASIGLAQKYLVAGDQRSWFLHMGATSPILRWTTAGTFATVHDISANAAPATAPGQRLAIRATLDVNNGAGGHTVTFYTAPTLAGPWTQLGTPVVTAGTTSVHGGTATVRVGDNDTLGVVKPTGKLYGFELRNGIGGTVVANPSASTVEPGPTTAFNDAAGRPWTVVDAWIADPNIRFSGEVASWPPRSDQTGTVVRVPLEASGILRRLGRSRAIAESTFRQQALQQHNLAVTTGYWPAEDASDATQVASALPGGTPLRLVGNRQFAADSTSFPGSAPLLVVSSGNALSGRIPPHAGTGTIAFRALFTFPPGGLSNGTVLVDLWQATGSPRRWRLSYLTASSGSLEMAAVGSGNVILQSGSAGFGLNGKSMMIGFTVIQDGADVDWHLFGRHVADGEVIQGGFDGTFTSLTVDRAAELYIAPNGDFVDVTLGHVMTGTSVTLAENIDDGMTGYAFEPAAVRIQRICDEGGIPCVIIGDPDDSEPCGSQRFASRLEVIQDAADADGGILFEPRDFVGLAYRTRASIYTQRRRAAFSITGKELTPPLEPTDDDQLLRNDVTANRLSGSSARAALETGPLSTQDPPDGVGVYPQEVTVNVAEDEQLPDVANWLLRLGTWDESRYPTVRVDPPALALEDKLAVAVAAAELDVGDRFTLTDPPAWLPPRDVDLLAQGFTERFDGFEWTLDINASPGGPWAVAEVHDDDATHDFDLRVAGGDDMALSAAAAAVDTTLLVGSVSGEQRWATVSDDAESPDDFPMDAVVGGEVVTITDVDQGFRDSFSRTVSNGMGTPGVSYPATAYVVEGTASLYSVVGGTTGRINTSVTNTLYMAHADMGSVDGEIYVTTSIPVVPTGAPITVRVAGRCTDAANYYEAQISIATTGVVTLQIFRRIGGSGGVLDSGGNAVTVSGAHSAGNSWSIGLKYFGTTLAAKAWKTTNPQPGWLTVGQDDGLTTGTRIGFLTRRESGNTNGATNIDFDDFVAVAPQRLTVTRSTNGISKAHDAGTVIEVAEPADVAW